MSVRHAGYHGDGIEEYHATRHFPSGTTLTALNDCVDELRHELFAHREGMEVEGSSKARVDLSPAAFVGGTGGLVVVVRGFWVDREARDLAREDPNG